ncbi:peptidoglycan hydrolase-like protein with peptidoglycan-binding domain [Amycolatopsis sulphurea]|uniref:Peptidoglycan hydrolase-like protein with peptidoglycan-binding domain n=1 Tax=Amycolatopsis sulphurea TaxID=76022 RepID=A0A2A9FAB5_9PSEU|nr:peptidoglycan-binding protein [Amycolatopsis sulphurea]PFG48108.1 peptidoglycan hydrolase-like protein with peptidoglycan-binding domain [Amycolatopsis sulphurea]
MAVSQNGWPVDPARRSRTVPGTNVRVVVADGPAGDVLVWVLAQFDRRVEDLDAGADDWGYANRPIRGSTITSNHASATAVDANATRHPLGKRGTFTAGQVAEIHRILSEVDNVVRWGGDYTGRRDEMHFEINASYARVAAVAARLNGGTPAPPAPGSGGHATVKRGSAGADVALVQRYLGLKADGIFGADTEAAVKRYQSAQHLTADGIVGPATWARIAAGLGGSVPGTGGGGPAPAQPGTTLKRGSQGPAVTALQRRLNAWYPAYSHLTADGVYGVGTESVVKEFQRRAGLTADGIAGPRTLAALKL